MFFVYAVALLGFLSLLGAAIAVSRGWLDESTDVEPDPYQVAIDSAGRLQSEAWDAIQRLHEIRVAARSGDGADGSATEDPARSS